MVRWLVIAACVCWGTACRGHHASESGPDVVCPTGEELVRGRDLGPQTRAAYVVTARRCIADGWSQRAIRCVREARDFDAEDRCLDDLLTAGQREGLEKALGELAAELDAQRAPPTAAPGTKGVPGLVVVERDGGYALRRGGFAITLPGKPWVVETSDVNADKVRIPATVAQFDDGPSSFTVVVHAIPEGVAYEPARDLAAARDDVLGGAGAKLVSESAADVGGVPGLRVVGRGGTEASPLQLEVRLVHDPRQRLTVVTSAMTRGATLDPRAAAMFASLQLASPGN